MLLEKVVSGLCSWTGREFHGCGPAAAKVLSPKLAVVMTWHLLTAAVCGGFVAGCPPRAGRFRLEAHLLSADIRYRPFGLMPIISRFLYLFIVELAGLRQQEQNGWENVFR